MQYDQPLHQPWRFLRCDAARQPAPCIHEGIQLGDDDAGTPQHEELCVVAVIQRPHHHEAEQDGGNDGAADIAQQQTDLLDQQVIFRNAGGLVLYGHL